MTQLVVEVDFVNMYLLIIEVGFVNMTQLVVEGDFVEMYLLIIEVGSVKMDY